MRITSILSITLIFILVACKDSSRQPSKRTAKDTLPGKSNIDPSIPGNFSTQRILHFDSTQVDSFLAAYPLLKDYSNDIRQFYAKRQYSFAWFDSLGIIEQAGNLLNRMENITDEGLPQKAVYRKAFDTLVSEAEYQAKDQKMATPSNVQTELMLTAQYFFYARHVWQGIPEEESKAMDWYLPRKTIAQEALLDSLLKSPTDGFLADEPLYHQYYLLKNELKKYRDIATRGGWPSIKADKKKYQPGDTGTTIGTIRKYLSITGDLVTGEAGKTAVTNKDSLAGNTAAGANEYRFDSTLANAVKRFQRRYGMSEDAIIGAGVLKEMNVTVEKRIEQIIVNMERCRWVPAKLQTEYIVVNIPDYKLHVFNKDSLLWSMNVVVGQTVHKTVIFYGELKYVVFSPYWNVPPGILEKEVLPGIKKDPNYLARHKMEKVGNNYRQKPGPDNSLGLVKFLFPNSYNIYLHDTPSKGFFDRDNRAFSHGCIRLSQPKKMAEYLLRDEPEWTSEKITQAMNAGKEKYVTLKKTVPVFIAYLTAWVSSEGQLNFRQDVYNRDTRLAQTIMQ